MSQSLLKKSDPIRTLKLSDILANGLLKKYNSIYPYSVFEEKMKQITEQNEIALFHSFCDILKGKEQNTLYLLNKSEPEGITIYEANSLETKSMLFETLELVYYFQYMNSKKLNCFENIEKSNPDFIHLINNGFNFFDKSDYKVLMSYFWNYEIHFKVKS